jgi:DNA polymerase
MLQLIQVERLPFFDGSCFCVDLLQLRGMIKNCSHCKARLECTKPVPPLGPIEPKAIVVGRNPGFLEDKHNKPFYFEAPSGKLVTKYLSYLGLDRSEVYITNTIMCYTAKNRPPTQEEIEICSRWKYIEFATIKIPKLIILFGTEAAKLFLGNNITTITKVLGNIYITQIKRQKVLIVPLPHPSYVLRNRKIEPKILSFLIEVKDILFSF